MTEVERLKINSNNQLPPEPSLRYIVIDAKEPEKTLKLMKELMEGILKYETHGKSVDNAASFFPEWFLDTFIENNSKGRNMEFPYYYESWLEAINARQWGWWSSGIDAQGIHINLMTYDMPYMVDPFVYMLTTLDIKLKQILFSEMQEPFRKLNIA